MLATLRPLGYQFVTFATGFEPTEHPEADDTSPPPAHHGIPADGDRHDAARASSGPIPGELDRFRQARERINYLLDHLPDVARDPRPTFTFAHLLCPHPPIIFGRDGEDVAHEQEASSLRGRTRSTAASGIPSLSAGRYRDQAAYITRRIQETIDRILAESPEPPIIIVQSDHGSELNLDM